MRTGSGSAELVAGGSAPLPGDGSGDAGLDVGFIAKGGLSRAAPGFVTTAVSNRSPSGSGPDAWWIPGRPAMEAARSADG